MCATDTVAVFLTFGAAAEASCAPREEPPDVGSTVGSRTDPTKLCHGNSMSAIARLSIPPEIRANVRIDFLAAMLYGAFGGLTTPFIPVMGRRLGASSLEVSLLVAAPALVLLLSIWVANLIRSVHPVRLVTWSAFLGRMLFLSLPAVHSPKLYIAVIVLFNAIASIGPLGYAQVIRTIYPEDVRGRIMALVRVGMAGAWVVGSLVGGRLMQLVPFQWVFAGAGVLGMASAVAFSRMRMPGSIDETEPIDIVTAWHVLRSGHAFGQFLVGISVFGFGVWLIGPAIPILLVDALHATSFQVGLLGAATSGMWLLSYYSWGKMIDRETAPGALKSVFLIGALTPVIYLVAPNAWVVQLAGITDGLTSAGVDLGWLMAVLQYAPMGQVRHYVAIFNTLVGIRGSTAPFLAGLLIPSIGVRPIFAIGAALMVVGAWIMSEVAAQRARSSTV